MGRRIEYVDGLRAIAVLSVLAFHTAAHNPALVASAPALLIALLQQGCHGVDLFFVISGFCLSYPILARLKSGNDAPFDVCAFAARRIVRIVPPYYAAIAVLLIVSAALAASHAAYPASMPQHGFSAGDIIRQALFFDANVRLLNDVFWTLAVEFRWYFIFPIALWLWVRSPKAFAVVGVLALFAAMATRAASVDLAVLPTFMLGIVAAELHLRDHRAVRAFALPAFAVASVAAIVTAQHAYFMWSAAPLFGLASFFFVVAAGVFAPLRSALSLKGMTLIGFTSYSIYLVHEPARALLQSALAAHFSGWMLWTFGAVGSVAIGMLFSYVAERPFVSTPLRTRMVVAFETAFAAIFQRLGIARYIHLPKPPKDATIRAVA